MSGRFTASEVAAIAARRYGDYQSGRWCGECRWNSVADPQCCYGPDDVIELPPVSGVAGNPEKDGNE